jgi:iron complex transport system ATP-binding protein
MTATDSKTGHTLTADSVDAGYTTTVIHEVSLALTPGACTALVGPNGSGKSTLLRALIGVLRTRGGSVLVDGDDVRRLRTRELARRVGVLHQGTAAPESITVRQLVEQGRYPHAGPLGMLRRRHDPIIDEALFIVDLADDADRPVDELSGGERQRAWLALTLVQEAPILLLDEPTTFLDIGHQMDTLALIDRLRTERRLTVLAVLHDLNHAFAIAQHVVVMSAGCVVAAGPPDTIITPALLREVFGVHAHVGTHTQTGVRYVVPLAPAGARTQLSPTGQLPLPRPVWPG